MKVCLRVLAGIAILTSTSLASAASGGGPVFDQEFSNQEAFLSKPTETQQQLQGDYKWNLFRCVYEAAAKQVLPDEETRHFQKLLGACSSEILRLAQFDPSFESLDPQVIRSLYKDGMKGGAGKQDSVRRIGKESRTQSLDGHRAILQSLEQKSAEKIKKIFQQALAG